MTDLITATTTGPVTIDDVRAALGETDPNATNAGALRRILGRGSFSTIQRHLDTIRADGMAQKLEFAGAAPDLPRELIAALWTHAWTAAQARTAGALASAQADLAATAAAREVAQADAEAAQAEADAATAELEAIKADAAALAQAHATELDAVKAQAAQQEQTYRDELTGLRAALAEAHAAHKLADAKHEAAHEAMRGELDRLVSQLADLRAALGRNAPTGHGEQAQRKR